jgi:hypothetical protein
MFNYEENFRSKKTKDGKTPLEKIKLGCFMKLIIIFIKLLIVC